MFLELSHTKLDVFSVTKQFVLECYKETKSFPQEEKFGMISQTRRVALSVHLNVSEGCSRKSGTERKTGRAWNINCAKLSTSVKID